MATSCFECSIAPPAGPAELPHAICLSCRTTHQVRPLDRPKNASRLRDIEAARRRMLHALLALDLPVVPKEDDTVHGIAFDLLESLEGDPRVLTGHAGGLITINVAEADDDYREFNREALREPYRTVLGHLRHEVGHYCWDRLIAATPWLPRFHTLCRDERADYGEALRLQYAHGSPADCRDRHISAYAACHPWEDWAESWAHYMHARATLGTVESFGLGARNTPIRITPFDADVLYQNDDPTSSQQFFGWINA